MTYVFWACFALAAAAFVGYPAAMVVRARLMPGPLSRRPGARPEGVSVVLAVRDGARWLDDRIEDLLAQEYPPGPWEIIIVSNGSTDGTENIARRWAASDGRITALTSEADGGKAGALNRGVGMARYPTVVFADVRQRFKRGAIRELLEPFDDPDVGAVTGRLVVEGSDRPGVEGFRAYWQLETRLRLAEAATGSVVGATGAIYAIRRGLYEPVPPGTLLDDVYTPMSIALRGYRVYMTRRAVAYDTPSVSEEAEYRRRVRTLAGNLQLLRLLPGVISPFRGLGWRFFFHKLLRVITPLLLLGMVVGGIMVEGVLYTTTAIGIGLLYLTGLIGLFVPNRLLSVPASFLLIQVAGLEAMLRPRRTAERLWDKQANR